jgi:hypothetical protein
MPVDSDERPRSVPKMPRILALDIAHHMGWCEGEINATPVSGSLFLGGRNADIIDRCIALEDWLADRLRFRPDVLAIEAPIPLSAMSQNMSTEAVVLATLGMSLVARVQAQRSGMSPSRIRLMNVMDVRKHFVGTRTFKVRDDGKRAAAHQCEAIGWEVNDFDAADAVALWDAACAITAPGVYSRGLSARFTGRLPSTFRPSIGKGLPPKKTDGPLFKALT